MIQIFSNTLSSEELAAIERIVKSRWIGPGQECKMFEAELARYFGVGRVLLLNSATSAIYIAARCLDVKPGDEVIIPSIHFVATANAVIEAGGKPVFCDVNPRTLNIKPSEISRLRNEKTVGAIINHYGGHPCDMNALHTECRGLWMLEDAANAPSSLYYGKQVGTFGSAGVWSFDSMKILSMSDGGCLYIADDMYERAWRLRNHGLDAFSGQEKSTTDRDKWWEFSVAEPSCKFDSNDLLACIGRIQLRKLREFVTRREQIWRFYNEALSGIDRITLPPEPLPHCTSSYYLYWIQVDNRDKLARHLYDLGIYTTFRYYPLHLAFATYDFGTYDLPGVREAAGKTLCLPIHQNLSYDDISRVVDGVRKWAAA